MNSPSTRLLPVLALVVLAASAGCLFGPGANDAGNGTIESPTTDDPSTETTRCHCAKNGRFELHDGYDGTVTIVVVNVTDGANETVAEKTYTEQYGVRDLDPVMRYGSDYRVIVRVDGSEAWNETISRSEGYETRLHENGTVTVTSYSIV